MQLKRILQKQDPKNLQTKSGDRWREMLAEWAIPKSILDQAPENPWIHPPAMFQIPPEISDTPSHLRARESVPAGGTVLDVGCGGGIAAFALTPPATHVIGVDHQVEMLHMFSENAQDRGVTADVYEGFWPAISGQVPTADVAVAHHVVYNVPNIEDFLLAMNEHASKRVVLELPQQHPLTVASPLWQHFWNLDRPADPTAADLMKVMKDLGFDAHLELWNGAMRSEIGIEQAAHFSRIRLCLPETREREVLDFLLKQPPEESRRLATIWWNTR